MDARQLQQLLFELTTLRNRIERLEVLEPPAGSAGGGTAPADALYVCLAPDGTLTRERVLTAGAGITITDGGANNPVTVALAGALHDPVTLSLDADANLLALVGQEIGLDDQVHNFVFAGPAVGGPPACPTWRSLVADDIPDLSGDYWAVGGNALGATLVGGTTDAQDVELHTAGVARLTIDALGAVNIHTGNLLLTLGDQTIAVGNLTLTVGDLFAGNGVAHVYELVANELFAAGGSAFYDAAGDMLLYIGYDTSTIGIGTVGAPAEKLDVQGNIQFGAGAAATDYYLKCDGETNDGLITWMEDEDYWQFADGVMIPAGEQVYFRDTALYIHSNADGYLDLVADTGVRVSTLTATRVIFAGASGLLTDSASFTYTTGTGQLAVATTGSGAGLLLGGDAQWYRSAANVLRTPDSLIADGVTFIGDTANAKMTLGLTINQGAADDEILTLKSSDVSHGMTSLAEADTFGTLAKFSSTAGGVQLRGYGESYLAPTAVIGCVTTVHTTKSTSGYGCVELRGYKDNGAGSVGSAGANGNLVVIRDYATTRFIFDAEGDFYYDGALVNYDRHDDLALLQSFHDLGPALRGELERQYAAFVHDHLALLQELGIITAVSPAGDRAMTCGTKLTKLLVGALLQLAARVQALEA